MVIILRPMPAEEASYDEPEDGIVGTRRWVEVILHLHKESRWGRVALQEVWFHYLGQCIYVHGQCPPVPYVVKLLGCWQHWIG